MLQEILKLSAILLTSLGQVGVQPTGHGAVCITIGEKVIYVDPYSETTDYTGYPKADLVIFTHDHYDHFDTLALKKLVTPKTIYIGPKTLQGRISLTKVLSNGDDFLWEGIGIMAVPAYNIINKNASGAPFHPKGVGNGYVFTFGDKKVYLAGDTELIPEMKDLGHIDLALLPKNLPYTMSDEQFVEAVRIIGAPQVFAIHYFQLDRDSLAKAIAPAILLNK